MIKALLFDFYGVFLPDAYNAWLQNNHLTREGVFAELITKRDRGEIDSKTFLHGLSRAVGHEVTIEEIHAGIQEVDTDLVEVVRTAKEKYKVGLLSNASTALRVRLKDLGIYDLFDEIIISGETGHAKPSEEAFSLATKKLGVEPEAVLFIDDNPGNTAASKLYGLQSATYTTLDELRQTLRSYDVL